jgi:hypothetical protein
LEEIKEWGLVGAHRRRIILENAKQRKEATIAGRGLAAPISPRDRFG